MAMHALYILYSQAHGRYYVGSTKDVPERLRRHNAGLVKSTKAYRPWILVYKEDFTTRSEARKREAQIKRYKSGRAFQKLVK